MAAPEMPYAPPSAPGRTAATARRFTLTAGAAAPVPPAVLRLLLSAPPACDAFRLWCSANGVSGSVPVCTRVPPQSHGCLAYASQN